MTKCLRLNACIHISWPPGALFISLSLFLFEERRDAKSNRGALRHSLSETDFNNMFLMAVMTLFW